MIQTNVTHNAYLTGVKKLLFLGSSCIYPKMAPQPINEDPQYYRQTEVELLIGNPTKANTKLAWMPKYDLAMMVKEMVENDLKLV